MMNLFPENPIYHVERDDLLQLNLCSYGDKSATIWISNPEIDLCFTLNGHEIGEIMDKLAEIGKRECQNTIPYKQ